MRQLGHNYHYFYIKSGNHSWEIASRLIQRLDKEETLQALRDLPERLQELSAKRRSFMEVRLCARLRPAALT